MSSTQKHLGEAGMLETAKTKLNFVLKAKSVTSDKIADNAVTSDKLANNSITWDKLSSDVQQKGLVIEPLSSDEIENILN